MMSIPVQQNITLNDYILTKKLKLINKLITYDDLYLIIYFFDY